MPPASRERAAAAAAVARSSPRSTSSPRVGELVEHVLATLRRVLVGFVCGVVAGTALGALTGYSDAGAASARPDAAGAAQHPVDRLGAAVHPVVRHLRDVEGDADRGRRLLPDLPRAFRRDHERRPEAGGGRPHLPLHAGRDGLANPVAGDAAQLPDRAPRRPRPRLDVRRRRRVHGRQRGLGLPARRRADDRAAGDHSCQHPGLRRPRQDDRLAACRSTARLLRWQDSYKSVAG